MSELKRDPNLDAAGWPNDEYSADLGRDADAYDPADTSAHSRPLAHHEAPEVHERVGKDADRIPVLNAGTRLRQGSAYLDLERLDDGPFVAQAGQVADDGRLIVAKSDIDYETWNTLTGS